MQCGLALNLGLLHDRKGTIMILFIFAFLKMLTELIFIQQVTVSNKLKAGISPIPEKGYKRKSIFLIA